MKRFLFVLGILGTISLAQASQRCGNGWIADNKVCRIGLGTPLPASPSPSPSTDTYTPYNVNTAPASTPYTSTPTNYTPSRLFQYGNCKAARSAGLHDILSNSIDYAPAFDRDNDGIACESSGQDDILIPSSKNFFSGSENPFNPNYLRGDCRTTPNTIANGQKDQNGRVNAKPVDVYVIDSSPYVIIREFACANGYKLEEAEDKMTVDSTERIFSVKSNEAFLGENPYSLSALPVKINNQTALFYTDLLNAFSLTVRGQELHLIPTVIH